MTKKEINTTLQRLARFYKGNVPPKLIAEQLGVSEEEAVELWKEYLTSPPVVIKRKRTSSRKPKQKEPTPPKEKPTKKSHAVHKIALKLLPWGAGIIAAVALTRSVMFTYSYFHRNEDVFIAILMASLFGMVSFFTPSLAILAYEMKKWPILGVAVVAFVLFGGSNVYITVQEMDYNKAVKEKAVLESQDAILRGKERITVIEAELRTYADNKVKDDAEYKQLTVISQKALDSSDKVLYNRTRNNMATVQERIDVADTEIKKREAERDKIQNIPGFYSTTVLTEEKRAQARAMDMAFSIAIEIVGPVFLVIALFL